MRVGAWVEFVIVRSVRAALALLMIPLILSYALLAAVAYSVALVVTTVRPAVRRPVRVRAAT